MADNLTYAKTLNEGRHVFTGYKNAVRGLIRSSLLSLGSVIQRPNNGNFLRLLYCHYVFDDQVEKFDKIVSMLSGEGKFIDTETCIEMIKGEREIDGKYFHLSFDDGLRNVFANAIPVLRKHNVPALMFIPSSVISSDYESAKTFCLNALHCKNPVEMIRWEDLKMALSWGFEVGSHTRSHLRLSTIENAGLLKDEILGSKQEIEEHLGIKCKYFSYPYGKRTDIDDISIEAVKDAGYEACFGAFRGEISNDTDIFKIPRHNFEAHWPGSHVKFFALGGWDSVR